MVIVVRVSSGFSWQIDAGLRSTVQTFHRSDYFLFRQPSVPAGTFRLGDLVWRGIETLSERDNREHQACVHGNENADAHQHAVQDHLPMPFLADVAYGAAPNETPL